MVFALLTNARKCLKILGNLIAHSFNSKEYMPRPKKNTKNAVKPSTRTTTSAKKQETAKPLTSRVENDLQKNQSLLNIILGVLVVLVLGVLLFNFFTGRGLFNNNNNNQQALGPSQNTALTTPKPTATPLADVSATNLPGKYTVKSGDTLFLIAKKYYNDGWQYPQIAKANNMSNVNHLEVGQVLDIPKISGMVASAATTAPKATVTPTPTVKPTVAPTATPKATLQPSSNNNNTTTVAQTQWGPKITGDTYTVQSGDWLSKIAGRAYGDIYQYNKIAQANNITNVNIITPGTVLKIPR